MKEYDTLLAKANKENELLWREMREEKQEKYRLTKQYEEEHLENLKSRDTFKYKISQQSLQNAKSKSKKSGGDKKMDNELPGPRYNDSPIKEVDED